MKQKKLLALITMLTLILSLCPTEAYAQKTLSFKNISNGKKTMYVGKTFQVKTNLSIKKVSFASSKKTVASISKKGRITAKKAGKTTITAKSSSGAKKKFTLTVKIPKMFTVSKAAGSYKNSVKVTLTAAKGYDIYYTLSDRFSSSQKITSGSKKAFTITQTSTLQLYPVTEDNTLSTTYLNTNYKKYKNYASYTYKIITETTTTTATPVITPTKAPTQVPATPVVEETNTPANTTTPTPTPKITRTPSISPTPNVASTPTATFEATNTPSITQKPSAAPSTKPSATPNTSATATPAASTDTPAPDSTSCPEALRAEYKSADTQLGNTDANNKITLNGDSIHFSGEGAVVDGSTITITSAGTYVVTGKLTNGQILVKAASEDKVYLVFNGATIHCENNAPIYLATADKVILTLAEGTTNTLTDGSTYNLETDTNEPDATLFSDVALSINGTGTLNLTANYADGIKSKDNLKIVNGTINITAKDDGIIGRDMLGICGGTINVTAGGDGLKATNDKKATKGYIDISGGNIKINAGGDGIQAQTTLYIDEQAAATEVVIKTANVSSATSDTSLKGIKAVSGVAITAGTFTITTVDDGIHSDGWVTITGGNFKINTNADGISATMEIYIDNDNTTLSITTSKTASTAEDTSLKGIKAGTTITVAGGNFSINTVDDSIHSNGNITIKNGNMTLESAHKGIHANEALNISDGKINITGSYEGLEGNIITIDGGTMDITSKDDGINAASKNTTTSTNTAFDAGFGPGNGNFEPPTPGGQGGSWGGTTNLSFLYINGGYISIVSTQGDGIDVNGSLYMTGGTAIVNVPTTVGGNGTLDYGDDIGGVFEISGGTLIAAGTSSMSVKPTSASQYTLVAKLSNAQAEKTTVSLDNTDTNENILTFSPATSYQYILISSPKLVGNTKYTLNTNSSNAISESFTLSNTITEIGSNQGGNYGPGNRFW